MAQFSVLCFPHGLTPSTVSRWQRSPVVNLWFRPLSQTPETRIQLPACQGHLETSDSLHPKLNSLPFQNCSAYNFPHFSWWQHCSFMQLLNPGGRSFMILFFHLIPISNLSGNLFYSTFKIHSGAYHVSLSIVPSSQCSSRLLKEPPNRAPFLFFPATWTL